MARFHATALGRSSANLVAKMSLLLASTALVASCATVLGVSRSGEARFADPSLIYLETSRFLWADARERELLACANGTPVICTAGQSRLSLSHCGCLPVDD
jgi:hypothetical protein